MSRAWVVNASPLISLGTIGHIELLPSLCDEMIIPEGVAREVDAGPPSDAARLWLHERGEPFVREVGAVLPIVASWDLGLGEGQVLSLCHGDPSREAILDDGSARRRAVALGVPVRGTLSVIVLAKRRGLVPAARPLFEQLLANGLRADERVVERAIELAGE